ncbi:MAG: amino acid adenylation domain-containing protein [Gemmatimonadetes bacterium]|nr:amino acid adenylation domain-containing protein [Gemmatimonadota bacterium]
MSDVTSTEAPTGQEIAVIGTAGRFPGARDVEEFWRNLREGVDAISFFTEEEMVASGVSPETFRAPGYVPAFGMMPDPELFDAAFFGLSPREATILNPQHRVFLECAWEALERAGYTPESARGRIGVYASSGQNRYLYAAFAQPELRRAVGDFQLFLWNGDVTATLTSFKLGLEGPSLNVQTACSSSLVAVHLGCQSLLTGESDMVLAGGVSLALLQKEGYHYQPGGIRSPDGRCRTFDAEARGTVGGTGVGVVVLKRLEDALADGDHMLAVIRGSAINNDGSEKVGFTTPRKDGQAAVIAEALAVAGVEPDTIGYVEAHGSGTEVGDPIEVAALTRAFAGTERTGFCALGAVKTGVGHLDEAAGVTGLIKTVLSLEHGEIPPSLHYEKPNPRIDFASSPFFVNTRLRRWERDGAPRRAGVSSFGMGGTNAHMVLEEAPETEPSGPSRPWQLLVVSARTGPALERATDRLVEHLRAHPEQPMADVAHTLRVGRRSFAHRRVVVCRDRDDAIAALAERDPRRLLEAVQEREGRPVVFLFPGLGDHYAQMARGLYEAEPVFRREVDRCAEILRPYLGSDLRDVLFPGDPAPEQGADAHADPAAAATDLRAMLGRGVASGEGGALGRTALAQPAVFVTEYALARTWMEWGVEPDTMIGHSLGEYVAATLAGVFTLEDSLALVAERARLIEALPAGAMLAVPLSEDEVLPLLADGLALAAVNAPGLCTVSGPPEAVARLEAELTGRGVACRRLVASHAFHSPAMDAVAGRLVERVRRMRLRAPEIPFLSNVTGRPITAEEAMDPEYWALHLCRTVRFAEGMAEVLADPGRVLLEVGPGRTLGTFALHAGAPESLVLASLRHAYTRQSDQAFLLEAAGRLWMAGVRLDWSGFVADERRLRVPLPTYPFERQRYWLDLRLPALDTQLAGDGGRRLPAWSGPGKAVARRRSRRGGNVPAAAPRQAAALHARPDVGVRYVPPSGEVEARLTAIWQELLGFDRIGVHDDFFTLGGHSLAATQVVFRVKEEFGVYVPLESIFQTPTVAGLAAQVEALRAQDDATRLPPIVPVPRDGPEPLPLSYAQERMWALDRVESGSPAYNVPGALHVRGRLDVEVARRGMAEVVRRQELLRTIYAVGDDGRPVQVILPELEVPLPVEDLRHVPEAERAGVVRETLLEEARTPIDLTVGPVLRTRLLRLDEEEYVLAITIHHVAVDAWTWPLLFREWEALYVALATGTPAQLPELPVQYADYAVWQRRLLSGERLEESVEFWRDALRGVPTVLELPTDRPRPLVQSYRGGLYGTELDPGLMDGVRRLAREGGATAHMVFLAAFQLLLARYTGMEDFVTGTLVTSRARPETRNLFGYFLNTLPVRARPEGGLTFREFLDRVRGTLAGVYAHGEFPLQMLLELVQPERDPSRNPLMQVLLDYQATISHGAVPGGNPGFTARPADEVFDLGDNGTSKFDLSMVAGDPGGAATTLVTEYNGDLFDRSTVQRFVEHYLTLLAGAVATPDARLPELAFLAPGERRQVLEEWNDTVVPFARATLHGLVAAQAARTPHVVAVETGDHRLTYGELVGHADRLARVLRGRGIGPEDRVGVCLEGGPELVVAVLGVMRAGGAYVPLDPAYPEDRLAYMLADSGAGVLVTRSELRERLPAQGVEVLCVDRMPADGPPPGDPLPPAAPEQLAYVIYTSGSTGRPKGVMVPHAGPANLLADYQRRWPIAPGDRCSVWTSTSFDGSVMEIFSALAAGGTLLFVDEEVRVDAAALVRWLAERRIMSAIVPAFALSELAEQAGANPETIALRRLLVGVEPIPDALLHVLAERIPGVRVVNGYGPTETSICATWHDVVPGGESGEGPAPIGQPTANTRAYVLDAHLDPLPHGIPGELYLGGAQVTRGYLGRPELTAERFVPDPFSPTPGARAYRTGDRVRWRPDGELAFLGRTDAQVKIRGFRIEPGEVEAALLRQEGIAAAAVVARPDAVGGMCLVAFVVPSGGEVEGRDLRERLRAVLPENMVPSAFVALDALPTLPNGKLDRRALPEVKVGGEAEYEAPRDEVEQMVADLWAEVLGVERVGIHDDFFTFGGHSLHAVRLLSRVRQLFMVEVPMRALFRSPTVAGFVKEIEAMLGASDLAELEEWLDEDEASPPGAELDPLGAE